MTESAADFQLEPETPGEIPQRVIDELVHARTVAKDYAEAFNSAVTAQAEKFKIAPGALKRYVNAREADAMAKLNKETADLEKLIGVTE